MTKPRLVDATGQVIDAADTQETRGHNFDLRTNFSLQTGRGSVIIRIPGSDKAYVMLPAEARILGMQLVTLAERAQGEAAWLRSLLEIGGMSPEEAVTVVKNIGDGTRQDHTLTYEATLKAARQEKAMDKGGSDGPAH